MQLNTRPARTDSGDELASEWWGAMTGKRPGAERISSEEGADAAVAEFIRTKGVTRCPTACVLPTQGSVAAADQAALAEYAAARDRVRQTRAAARQSTFFPFSFAGSRSQ
jgi:hypothetical protein